MEPTNVTKLIDPKSPPSGSSNPTREIGYAVNVNDYLISVAGLPGVAINEIVTLSTSQFTSNRLKDSSGSYEARGIVTALGTSLVEVLMLDDVKVKPKDMFIRTGQTFSVNAGEFLLGRTINPLGIPMDGRGKFVKGEELLINQPIRAIKARQFIKAPFESGVTTVDMLVPLAKGQRQLIIGDARAGKTSFLIDTIINQKGKNVICIYAMIGKSLTQIRQLVDVFKANHALEYSVLVATSSSDMASLIFMTPAVAFTIAEYFQKSGKDVLIILDDMGNHAKFYREISLLSNQAPGRESYPGDIFYQHAHLMERAGNFNQTEGNSSITALPVIEINSDDYTAFIPTNLMAMTDGHLMFDSNMYHEGVRPAINISLSVSRVGRQTQGLAQKLLSDKVRATLAEAQKLETLSRFGSEVSTQTQQILKQSQHIKTILKQAPLTQISTPLQMVLLGLSYTPLLMDRDVSFLEKNKKAIIQYLNTPAVHERLVKQIGSFSDDKQLINLAQSLNKELEGVCKP